MQSQPLIIGAAFLLLASAFGAVRFSGEKGTRAHLNRLAAGQGHACAVLDDGTVRCWGANNFGQLGDGTLSIRPSPVVVANLGTTISIAAGSDHTCAILTAGTVRCWGFNDSGQLGNGSTVNSSQPVAVTGLSNVISLAAGFLHTCAVRVDGTVWCWGAALANGSNTASSVPVKVNVATAAVSVTAGAKHSCVLLASSDVQCWGTNDRGQTANSISTAHSSPTFVGLRQVVEVSGGGLFTCGRLYDGAVSCWGDNTRAQYGNDTISTGGPAFVSSDATDTVAVTTGASHVCTIQRDGTANCWGNNAQGQLGYTSIYGSFESPHAVTGIANVVEIAAGGLFTCALIVDGSIRCWGDNSVGQHGDGITGQVGTDTVIGISGTFLGRGVTAGNQFPCGRRGSGTPACWGDGSLGQLGDSASVSSPNPVAVTGLSAAIAVSAGGGGHACSLDAAGVARCWGDNSRGQLGNGTTTRSNKPVTVNGNLTFAMVSAGNLHTCGITRRGNIACWGADDHGQLGDTGTADSSVPVVVDDDAVAIAAGQNFTCTLSVSGRVSCWGDNSSGQLGNGGTTSSSLPVDVGLQNIVGISAGASHVCALSAFGSILCWGANTRGQIGNNSTFPALFPTTVAGITDAVSVSAGAFFTCAAQAGGGVSCWGANDSGELAAIDSVDHLTPTAVGSFRICLVCQNGRAFVPLSGVVAIATGTSASVPTLQHACALLATGVIECWGNNVQGEVGDGTTTNQPRPTAVNSFAANVDPTGTLRNGHMAEVTALVNCDQDARVFIKLTLVQGLLSDTAEAVTKCTGSLLRVPMRLGVHGPATFQAGDATAEVEAVVYRDAAVVEDTHWTRQVTLSVPVTTPEDPND